MNKNLAGPAFRRQNGPSSAQEIAQPSNNGEAVCNLLGALETQTPPRISPLTTAAGRVWDVWIRRLDSSPTIKTITFFLSYSAEDTDNKRLAGCSRCPCFLNSYFTISRRGVSVPKQCFQIYLLRFLSRWDQFIYVVAQNIAEDFMRQEVHSWSF